jgi:hypothetical protein
MELCHRADVISYRLDAVLGSLRMPQLHGFDELPSNQGMIQNRIMTKNNMVVSNFLSAFFFNFRYVRLAKIIEFAPVGVVQNAYGKIGGVSWTLMLS